MFIALCLFVLHICISATMIVCFLLWILFVVLGPTAIADTMFGSNDAFESDLQCDDWEVEGDRSIRHCSMNTLVHHCWFTQIRTNDSDGALLLFPRDFHSETRNDLVVLYSILVAIGLFAFWFTLQKCVTWVARLVAWSKLFRGFSAADV